MSLKKAIKELKLDREKEVLEMIDRKLERENGASFKALREPLKPHEVEWRIQSAKYGKTTVVPYIKRICVMDRFDNCFGFNGWSNIMTAVAGGGFLCSISVIVDDKTITRTDVGSESNMDKQKGAASDSLKRASTLFGLGRDLYSYPRIQIKGEHKYISPEIMQRLDKLVDLVCAGEELKESYTL